MIGPPYRRGLNVDCAADGAASFSIEVSLENTPLTLAFDWNGREERWYVSVAGLLTRTKVVPFFPVFERMRPYGGPPGFLYFLNVDQDERPPTFNELGTRTLLIYVDSHDIPAEDFLIIAGVTPS